jgi:hypothetical protein
MMLAPTEAQRDVLIYLASCDHGNAYITSVSGNIGQAGWEALEGMSKMGWVEWRSGVDIKGAGRVVSLTPAGFWVMVRTSHNMVLHTDFLEGVKKLLEDWI